MNIRDRIMVAYACIKSDAEGEEIFQAISRAVPEATVGQIVRAMRRECRRQLREADREAGHQYRLQQAREIIRSVRPDWVEDEA